MGHDLGVGISANAAAKLLGHSGIVYDAAVPTCLARSPSGATAHIITPGVEVHHPVTDDPPESSPLLYTCDMTPWSVEHRSHPVEEPVNFLKLRQRPNGPSP